MMIRTSIIELIILNEKNNNKNIKIDLFFNLLFDCLFDANFNSNHMHIDTRDKWNIKNY